MAPTTCGTKIGVGICHLRTNILPNLKSETEQPPSGLQYQCPVLQGRTATIQSCNRRVLPLPFAGKQRLAAPTPTTTTATTAPGAAQQAGDTAGDAASNAGNTRTMSHRRTTSIAANAAAAATASHTANDTCDES